MATSHPDAGCDLKTPDTSRRPAGFLALPAELIDTVLSYLSPLELVKLLHVCHDLHDHAVKDIHWRRNVLSNIPVNTVQSPYPCSSWLKLFAAHHQYWFLTRNILWFCDRSLTGQMILVRYDQRRGCIEGYQLVATRGGDDDEPWLEDGDARIHHFKPLVGLHLDRPVLQFNVHSLDNLFRMSLSERSDRSDRRTRSFYPEHPIRYSNSLDPRFCTFVHAKPLDPEILSSRMGNRFPYGQVWPPPAIPARHRVLGNPGDIAGTPRSEVISSPTWRPSKRSEASDLTFRIRHWMELGPRAIGFHVGEELVTYSTLDSALYTPTEEKPWRGIWVGDYSVHGCEFLLIHQPDSAEEDDEEPLTKQENENDEEFRARFLSERVYRGRLEAIKLTGDPNVPRGEYTFVVEDLGSKGFIGVGRHPPFQGARIVKSQGHVAGAGFASDRYIDSQLILVSPNRLAQYWVDFGYISFFERVDIHQFLVPS